MEEVLRFAILGLGIGALYALASQGLIVIFRGAGILNFALGAIGMVGAYVAWDLRHTLGLPFWLSLVVGIGASALIGALTHLLIMRKLWQASPLVRIIATLGVLMTLQAFAVLRYGSGAKVVPPELPAEGFEVLPGIFVGQDRLILLAIAIVISLGLWALYRYTKFGLGTTAVAENPRAAAALGWSADRLATINWALGSALAGAAAILVAPIVTLQPQVMTNLLIAAIAAALIAGFRSFPIALVAGIVIGVVQTEVTRFLPLPGFGQSFPFLIIVIWMIVRGQAIPLRDFVAQRMPSLGRGNVNWVAIVVLCAITIGLMTIANMQWRAALTMTFAVGVILLSIVVLTGYAGQLSLAQVALAGFGAWVAGQLSANAGIPFLLALVIGILATIPVGLLFALPAVRTRGISLAVVTLGLGMAIQLMLFNNTDYTGGVSGTQVPKPEIFGLDISAIGNPLVWGIFNLVVFVLAALVVANLRRSRSGARLIAVRTNERAAAALGVNVAQAKLYAFALSAGLAALGGILLAYQSTSISYGLFDSFNSITYVGFALIGGIGYIAGPLIGALMAQGGLNAEILDLFGRGFDAYVPLVGGLFVILFILLNQNGVAHEGVKQVAWFTRRVLRVEPRQCNTHQSLMENAPPVEAVRPARLVVDGLTVRYGGTTAVSRVSLVVKPGEVVGLIGPNGAGKTSFIDAVTGFTRITEGRIRVDDRDIAGINATARARAGVGRSFQSLELFEDLTVLENLRVAADPKNVGAYFTDLIWSRPAPVTAQMVTAIREFGLEEVLDTAVEELSYGQRRLLGIARAVAAGPSILLLDEPAAGLGDAETAELAALITRMAREFGVAVLLVEHDMNLVMSVCDRLVVLDFGKVISEGTPAEVQSDPAVVSAYLGQETQVSGDAETEERTVTR